MHVEGTHSLDSRGDGDTSRRAVGNAVRDDGRGRSSIGAVLVRAVTDTVGEVGVGAKTVGLVGGSRGAAEAGGIVEQAADTVFLIWESVDGICGMWQGTTYR